MSFELLYTLFYLNFKYLFNKQAYFSTKKWFWFIMSVFFAYFTKFYQKIPWFKYLKRASHFVVIQRTDAHGYLNYETSLIYYKKYFKKV